LLIETEADSGLLEIVHIDQNHFHLVETEERVAHPAAGPLINLFGGLLQAGGSFSAGVNWNVLTSPC
jgi:hypothetical protein